MLSHRDQCHRAAKWFYEQYQIDLVSFELKVDKRSIVDVIGLTTYPTTAQRKILIGEVKVTRADLLQDLRKGKMLKYQKHASHCYLLATRAALNLNKQNTIQLLTELDSYGLPKSWGIVLLPDTEQEEPILIRKPQRLKIPRYETIQKYIRKIARSYMYKILLLNSNK